MEIIRINIAEEYQKCPICSGKCMMGILQGPKKGKLSCKNCGSTFPRSEVEEPSEEWTKVIPTMITLKRSTEFEDCEVEIDGGDE